MNNKRLLEIYLGELSDRALRFLLHLKAVDREFYSPDPNSATGGAPKDKPLLLASFRQCIVTQLEIISELGSVAGDDPSDASRETIMQLGLHSFLCINELHEKGLLHLPRPTEPVELSRFCRIISRHVLSGKTNVAVYVTETIPEGAYAADPLSRLKEETIKNLVEIANGFLNEPHVKQPGIEGSQGIHVTIARIDARNPVRWPTLLHETGHKLLNGTITNGVPLLQQFQKWCPAEHANAMEALKVKPDAWLTEVWCDLFAALVMGPCFYFSQVAAFISSPPSNGIIQRDYPPHGFRLRLILMFLRHRYGELIAHPPLRQHMQESLDVVEYWDKRVGLDVESEPRLMEVFDLIRVFFQDHFFSGAGTDTENFQAKFESMVRYVRAIEIPQLEKMQAELANGLPVPSKPRPETPPLNEEPCSVQEVLLAAWLNRLHKLRDGTLQSLRKLPAGTEAVKFETELLPSLDRFDDAVLRSLQLAEWLHVLAPDKPPAVGKVEEKPEGSVTIEKLAFMPVAEVMAGKNAILNDRQIASLIAANELRVLPLVDFEQQLGSTSLDIRLGTSFQVYLPACRRPAMSPAELPQIYESRRIDLDFLEHVVLMPGQFMLGHSFEYLKLPDWLAADLDGRSSYARLGLEIHMTAGMIDPGFQGVVTFELFNSGPSPIPLFPGVRIAQLRFTCLDLPLRPYSTRHRAKYRGLLQHNVSLHMNDPEVKKIRQAVEDLSRDGA